MRIVTSRRISPRICNTRVQFMIKVSQQSKSGGNCHLLCESRYTPSKLLRTTFKHKEVLSRPAVPTLIVITAATVHKPLSPNAGRTKNCIRVRIREPTKESPRTTTLLSLCADWRNVEPQTRTAGPSAYYKTVCMCSRSSSARVTTLEKSATLRRSPRRLSARAQPTTMRC